MILWAVVASILTARTPFAQTERTLDRTPSCVSCTILITQLANIRDDGDLMPLGPLPVMVMLDSARAAIWSGGMNGFRVLTLPGNSIQQIGSNGAGPGEYESIANVLPMGDGTFYVIDRRLRRVTHLSAQLKVIKSFPLQHSVYYVDNVVSPNGTIVHAGALATPKLLAQPFHLFGPDGKFRASFGGSNSPLRPKDDKSLVRRVTTLRDGTFWSISPADFRLQQWSFDMKLLQTITFPDAKLRERQGTEWHLGPDAPPDFIAAISMFARDTLLVLTRTPKRPWPGVRKVTTRNAEGTTTNYSLKPSQLDQYFDTRLDLIDLKAARLVTTTLVPKKVWSAGGRELTHESYDENDMITLELLRAVLKQE